MSFYKVIALENVNIQQHTEAVVSVKVVYYIGKNVWGIVEPADKKFIPGICVGKVLTNLTIESTVVPVRMVNFTGEKRKVTAEAVLVKCEAIKFVVYPKSVPRIQIHEHNAETSNKGLPKKYMSFGR